MSESHSPDRLKDLMSQAFEQDPKLAIKMMMSAIKMPMLKEFLDDDSANETVSLTIKKGDVIFLFGACLETMGMLSNSQDLIIDGQMHIQAADRFKNVSLTIAELAESIGYPEEDLPETMITAMCMVDRHFERMQDLSDRVQSGEVLVESLDDIIGREFQ